MKVSRVAVIGLGSWGARVAEKLRDLPGFRVVSVFDTNTERCEAVATLVGANAALSVTGAASGADCAVVAVPPGLARFAVLCELVDAGVRHVRVEKPLALSYDSAVEIVELGASSGTVFSVGHTSIWGGLVPSIKMIVGELAAEDCKQRLLFTRLCSRAPAHHAGTSPLWDLAPHDIALHHAIYPHLWDAGPPVVLDATERADGTAGFVLDDGSQFICGWTHPTTRRGIICDAFVYDEGAEVLHAAGESWTPQSEVDPLSVELTAWRLGHIVSAQRAAAYVHVCENAQRLIDAKRAGVA